MTIAGDFLFIKFVGENQQHSASRTAIVVWEQLVSLGALLVIQCGYYAGRQHLIGVRIIQFVR